MNNCCHEILWLWGYHTVKRYHHIEVQHCCCTMRCTYSGMVLPGESKWDGFCRELCLMGVILSFHGGGEALFRASWHWTLALGLAGKTSGCSCHAMDHHFVVWWSSESIMMVGLLGRGGGIGKQNLAESSPCRLVQPLFAKESDFHKTWLSQVQGKPRVQLQVKSGSNTQNSRQWRRAVKQNDIILGRKTRSFSGVCLNSDALLGKEVWAKKLAREDRTSLGKKS